MTSAADMLQSEFASYADVMRAHASERPDDIVVVAGDRRISFAEYDRYGDRIAAGLQRDGVQPGEAVSICGLNGWAYATLWLGILRAGGTVAPLAQSSTPEALRLMVEDCGTRLLFADQSILDSVDVPDGVTPVTLDDDAAFEAWLPDVDAKPEPVEIDPEQGFNIIYSSGTTGTPKGIVHSHQMRWRQVTAFGGTIFTPDAAALLSTPLYSNTTLVSFLPCVGNGGKAVLVQKFKTKEFLELSEREKVTTAMLVPVQYKRLMEEPEFDSFDLSSYQMKFCTSAPFSAELKADILKRWPGGLVEFYGMTEGGGSCALRAHEFPDKLHTVGQPMPGHEIRLIDEEGKEVPQGEIGEIVGRSGTIMKGYHNRPEQTRETEWYDEEGNRYIRTGDVGRFDEDGFLTLMDRRKDMIISGGFNIYPSDLEAVVVEHPEVEEVAVIGVHSDDWGETPVGVVVGPSDADAIKEWANAKLGKTQRLAAVHIVDELPRSAIGKVLKRELRDSLSL
ncbi:acyl--CoA ligase [Parasphingopyxis sp. CP4]|uniref:class I adenylate-forming enzyme family protein n=1 Tax=Parasphingopyxis sp. CP4 TaxID=2724527 RepID=UPI0015A17850|nr:class I adenylate-forming enzyme family protein [Parasphingopyxis sp. CP4]QLC20896.1 acyl--CoA ligase [Parasphingopyxis sp. CP4]